MLVSTLLAGARMMGAVDLLHEGVTVLVLLLMLLLQRVPAVG